MIDRRTAVALLASPIPLTGCEGRAEATPRPKTPPSHSRRPTVRRAPEPSAEAAAQRIPGLGPKGRNATPGRSRQVVVATGHGEDSPESAVVPHERTEAGRQAGAARSAHNALRGWSDHHTARHLRSPVGVHTLTEAGGLLRAPGTRLPYHRSTGSVSPGTGFAGEPPAGSFGHVIAVDCNRKPGTPLLDGTRPLGAGRGGGIRFHAGHGGPTHGRIGIAEAHMKALRLALDPGRHPVVVMGHADRLAL
ncbi:hypothetical protein ACWDG1_43815 [Streptomyces sp. NPDC001177]